MFVPVTVSFSMFCLGRGLMLTSQEACRAEPLSSNQTSLQTFPCFLLFASMLLAVNPCDRPSALYDMYLDTQLKLTVFIYGQFLTGKPLVVDKK